MKEVNDVINSVSMDQQIDYLQWNVINSAASYLSDDFEQQWAISSKDRQCHSKPKQLNLVGNVP